jgi:N-methylhydantoinase B
LPPAGLFGGQAGAPAKFLINDHVGDPYGLTRLQPGDVVTMDSAGGGGYGEAKLRDRAAVLRDVRAGKVSREAAWRDYGVEVTDEMLK